MPKPDEHVAPRIYACGSSGLMLLVSTQAIGIPVVPVANVHSAPTEEPDAISQAIYGSNSVIEEQPGWVNVGTPDDHSGRMPLASLRLLAAGDRAYRRRTSRCLDDPLPGKQLRWHGPAAL